MKIHLNARNRAHQFDAAHLVPDQIVRVIYHAHLVGLGVAYTHGYIVMSQHD